MAERWQLHGALNLYGDDWVAESDRPGYRWRRARIAGERLAASLYELPPGERTWPYHFHWGNEELLLVVAGRPTLREPRGERELHPGDLAWFAQGPDGAHQVMNRTDEPARVLIFSTLRVPGSSVYPDSDKVSVRWGGGEDALLFRRGDAADYWEGEE